MSLSSLSVLRRGFRVTPDLRADAASIQTAAPGLSHAIWFTRWHPVRIPLLDRWLTPFWQRYARLPLGPVEPLVRGVDVLVFESGVGLLLLSRFAALSPGARLVYRVSDDLRVLRAPRVVLDAEAHALERFDLVSVPTAALAARFARYPAVAVQPHGVDTAAFDAAGPSPYPADGRPDAVFVGVSRLDVDFLARATRLAPEWRFHVIGPFRRLPRAPNLQAYGELPFDATVAYVRHARVGLATLAWSPGAEVFADSLKIQQFTYCRLPIVAPEFLRSDRPHLALYRPGDDASIRDALARALAVDRAAIPVATVHSWRTLAAELLGSRTGAGRPAATPPP